MRKQRVIELRLNNTFVEQKVPTEINQLKTGDKNKEGVEYEPVCVFHEVKKGFIGKLKSKRNIVLYVEGAKKALRFSKITESMNPLWTKKEAKELVKKEMAKSLIEHKPMKWSQFIIILIPVIAILIILLKVAMTTGAF